MKKQFYAPYGLLALALVGIAVAFYDAYQLYNGQAAVVSAAHQWMQRGRE